jgi:hypothetical protein
MKHAKLLSEVLLALGKVEVIEQLIRDPENPKNRYYGLQENSTVWIDPTTTKRKRVAVETLIHEVIHHLREKWSEDRVWKMAGVLGAQLSPEQVTSVHKIYQLIRKKRRGKVSP